MGDRGDAGAVPSVAEAQALARELLEPLGSRWAHVQAVAARAEELRPAVESEDDQQLLVVGAWWHDLGYAPELRQTGAHQIDGALYLTSRGFSPRLCALVAHHSATTFEARERGLLAELEVWPREEGAVADALWMSDMTTGPAGQRLDYSARLADILERYEPDSVVHRAMRDAEPEIRGAIFRTQQRIAAVHAI
jgi:hypothetical protein